MVTFSLPSCLFLLYCLTSQEEVFSFQSGHPPIHSSPQTTTQTHRYPPFLPKPLKSPTTSSLSQSSPVEFELQELRAQLNGMRKAGLSSSDLNPTKRLEIESYVRAVATKAMSPTPLSQISQNIKGTWRLAFSTEDAALKALPKHARVYLKFYNDGKGRLDYTLRFTKRVLALRNLTAKSYFEISTSPPNPGLVSYQYQEITCDVFGITIPTGLFGLLKGRVNYIDSVYFDDFIWMDRGYSPEGVEYFNVFIKVEEDDDEPEEVR